MDRSTLETLTVPVDEFVEILCDKLELLRPHCFIASEQARFFKECKSNLVPGEVLVTAEFFGELFLCTPRRSPRIPLE